MAAHARRPLEPRAASFTQNIAARWQTVVPTRVEYGTLARISSLMEAGRETGDVDSFAVTFDREPQWAADAINDGFGLPVVPGPMNIVGGRPKPLTTKMLVLLSAVLEAAAALSPETPSVDAQIAHGDLAITVQITAPA